MAKRAKNGGGRLKVAFVYVETFWTEHLGREAGPDKYEYYRMASGLPLGLGTVRAYAEQDRELAGRVEMHNRIYPDGVPDERICSELKKLSPDIIALTLFLWNAPNTYRICRRLASELPGARIVVGGPEVPRREEALRGFLRERPYIEAAFLGEGEAAFVEYLKARLEGRRPAGVKGLAFRQDGKVVLNGPRGGYVDVQTLPSPFLSGAMDVKPAKRGMVCLETSRGCPFNCAYCDYHAGGRKLRLFPIQRLADEMDLLIRKGFKGMIYIADPYLNIRKDRAVEALRVLQRWKHDFNLELHAESFDDETIAELVKIPKPSVSLGIQTTHPETLRNIDRRFDPGKAAANIRKLVKAPNMRLDLEFILGLPGDDYESFKRSMDWALQFAPAAHITMFDLALLANSPLASMKEKFKMEVDEESLVLSNLTFSREDMKRASRLFAAYCYLHGAEKHRENLLHLVRKKKVRPSDILEKVGEKLLREGYIPDERIIGQGGRRPEAAGKAPKGRPRRWVELERAEVGIEFGDWW